jgi:hypothetical protein
MLKRDGPSHLTNAFKYHMLRFSDQEKFREEQQYPDDEKWSRQKNHFFFFVFCSGGKSDTSGAAP